MFFVFERIREFSLQGVGKAKSDAAAPTVRNIIAWGNALCSNTADIPVVGRASSPTQKHRRQRYGERGFVGGMVSQGVAPGYDIQALQAWGRGNKKRAVADPLKGGVIMHFAKVSDSRLCFCYASSAGFSSSALM
ncbi:hypothetical protein [Limihaloglobus sulfuriphilus]|uniref:hypothetical protein n=1 Tax=Limihaloglobus sulfuriphilus TaxID=1851148 RepID=UPI0011BA9D68|nr:hypothetical protein [Limihaloglobus sulfuriphilus]